MDPQKFRPGTCSLRGQRVGPYEILDQLGRGGMGAVYRAHHIETAAIHAIKFVLAEVLDQDRDALERFEREAQVLARIDSHPGLIRVHAYGVERGMPWYSMELVDGRPLSDQLQKGPLPVDEAVALVAIIARAVHHAHGHGVIHRDLKPENVLIDQQDQPHLVDFGLALDSQGDRITGSDQIVGTLGFMAPEQIAGPRSASDEAATGPHTDVYGLGGLLYACLTAQRPFSGDHGQLGTFRLILEEPPRPIRSLRPEVPRAVEAVAHRALSKLAADRHESAAALADDLELWLDSRRVSTTTVKVPGRRAPSRGNLVVMASLAAFVVAVAMWAAPALFDDASAGSQLAKFEDVLAAHGELSYSQRQRLEQLGARAREHPEAIWAPRVRRISLIEEILRVSPDAEAECWFDVLVASFQREGDASSAGFAWARKALLSGHRPVILYRLLQRLGHLGQLVGDEPRVFAKMLGGGQADLTLPLEPASFEDLLRAPGLKPELRQGLLIRRAEELLRAEPAGYDGACAALIRSVQEYSCEPRWTPRAAPERWSGAFVSHCHGTFVRLLDTDQEAAGVLLLLLGRAPALSSPLPVPVVRRLCQSLLELGLKGGDLDPLRAEGALLTVGYLLIVGSNPLGDDQLRQIRDTDTGRKWVLSRAEEEVELPAWKRRPVVLVLLSKILVTGSAVGHELRESARRWLQAVDGGLRQNVAMCFMESRIRRVLEEWDLELELCERALFLDRGLPRERQDPGVRRQLVALLLQRDSGPHTLQRCARLLLQASEVQVALEPRRRAVEAAMLFVPQRLAGGTLLVVAVADLIGRLNLHGPPECDGGGDQVSIVEELFGAAREIAFRVGSGRELWWNRARHQMRHGELEPALESLEQAVRLGRDHLASRFGRTLVMSLERLALIVDEQAAVLGQLGRLEEVDEARREAKRLRERAGRQREQSQR